MVKISSMKNIELKLNLKLTLYTVSLHLSGYLFCGCKIYLRTATEDAVSSRHDPLVADDRQTTVETAEEFQISLKISEN